MDLRGISGSNPCKMNGLRPNMQIEIAKIKNLLFPTLITKERDHCQKKKGVMHHCIRLVSKIFPMLP